MRTFFLIDSELYLALFNFFYILAMLPIFLHRWFSQ